jgi:hypothetical protein
MSNDPASRSIVPRTDCKDDDMRLALSENASTEQGSQRDAQRSREVRAGPAAMRNRKWKEDHRWYLGRVVPLACSVLSSALRCAVTTLLPTT